MKMPEPTFYGILEEKYNLRDEIKCDGSFVRLSGSDKQAVDLLTLGLTERALIVARPLVTGPSMDFDLLAITPLPLIRLAIQNYKDNIISVSSQFKAMQVYQLCSSENQPDIWDRFVEFIEDLYKQKVLQEAADRRSCIRLKDRNDNSTTPDQRPSLPVIRISDKVSDRTITDVQYEKVPDANNNSTASDTPGDRQLLDKPKDTECPKEFEDFNKKYSMSRTFDNLNWYPKFSYKTPRLPCTVSRNPDLWSNLTDPDTTTPLFSELSEKNDYRQGLCSRLTATVKKVFRCFPWSV